MMPAGPHQQLSSSSLLCHLPLRVGQERRKGRPSGRGSGMRRHLGMVVEREGRGSFPVIRSKLVSAQPRSVLALSWVHYTENHIYFSQSNKLNSELIFS